MRNILLLICVTTFSCTTKNNSHIATKISQHDSILLAAGFDTSANYVDKSCIYYKGKPLLIPGQSIKLFDSTFSFRIDPNGEYQDYFTQGITDYLSIDDFYNVKLSTGTIDGILYFTTDNKKRVFKFACKLSIDADLSGTSGTKIITYLHDNYFPCLSPEFKSRRKFRFIHQFFIENFHLYPTPDSDHGHLSRWSFDYSIELKKMVIKNSS